MLLNFYGGYLILGLLLCYWAEGHIYLFSLLITSIRVDPYTFSFFCLLGVVGSIVGVWSYYYIDGEITYSRFILLLISFILRIVMLIFFSNLFMALIGWDGLGVTSFLLVVYYKNRKCLGSGMITALTNRLGDCLLLCRLGFFFITQGAHFLILILVISLRITKRAQFPFSSWLPAAMAAPTPVSALVHSSTLVTAGVYVLIRYCSHDMGSLLFIGRSTMLIAGIGACAERDLKKVVALRTLSQLGVMIVSLGCSEKSYCFFHLISHACFKALLFMCVGACIHSVYGTQDYRRFNKLRPALFASIFASVANISLIGFLFTSGFYRKDMILEAILKGEGHSWSIVLFLLGVGLTSCYSIKMLVSSILRGSFTATSSTALRGFSWQVKTPLLLLGVLRVSFGSSIDNYRAAAFVCLRPVDKIIPLGLILTGALAGYACSRLCNPLLSRMFTLVPSTQLNSSYSVGAGGHQKVVDKGWVEAGSASISPVSLSIISHYRPAIGLGLRAVLLLFLGQ